MTITISNRASLVVSGVALLVALGAAGGPVIAAAYDANNADHVDGKDAVSSSATKANRAQKLVATNNAGLLPNNIIKKAPNANMLDGYDSSVFLNNWSSDGADSFATPVTLSNYSAFTDVVTIVLDTDGANSPVLIVGQLTAEDQNFHVADVFTRLMVDGAMVDGLYWATMSTGPTTYPRVSVSVSRVVNLAPGEHTIKLQAAYWYGGGTETVYAYARALNAVELGG